MWKCGKRIDKPKNLRQRAARIPQRWPIKDEFGIITKMATM